MNNRERFLRIMGFKAVDRVPDYEIGIWPQTAERWKKEGMPPGVIGKINVEKSDEIFSEECLFFDKEVPFFSFEHIEFTRINTYIPEPEFEEVVIEEDERKIVYRDVTGVTHLAMKEGTVGGLRPSMDKYIVFQF